MKLGYARVSTDEQTLALQHDALRADGCEVIHEDKGISGTDMKRPGLTAALDVWSQDLVVRVLSEPGGLVHPGFADRFVGREAA